MKKVAIYTHVGADTKELESALNKMECTVKIFNKCEISSTNHDPFGNFDTVFYFPCGCCPDSFKLLSAANGAYGKRIVVIANMGCYPIYMHGVLEKPTTKTLIRIAKSLHKKRFLEK